MKRKFARRALSGLLSLLMVVGLLPFTAMAEGIPEYITPVYPATSDGITATAEQTGGGLWDPIYTITLEIGEDTTADKLDVNVAEEFADILQYAKQIPGATMTVNIEVINHSQYNYGYADNSLMLGTAPYDVTEDSSYTDGEAVSAFDGFTVYIGSWNDVTRSYNNALKALDIGINGSSSNSEIVKALGDENLSACLKNAGYTNGVADLGKYYIDYYNETHDTSISDLKEADMDYLVNIFKCMQHDVDYGQHNDTGIRETCPEVAALGYYYLYNHLVTINDEPLATYMEKGSASLAKLSSEFQEALAVPAGETGKVVLKSELDAADTANCYQNHVLLGGLSFALEKGEAKESYPGLDKKVGDDEAMNDDDVDAAAGQKVNFQLTSNVPTDLLNYLNPKDVTPPSIDGEEPGTAEKVGIAGRGEYVLTFHDKLNEKLINPENYVVKIGDTPLTEGQYTLTATDLEDGCSFEIALDLAALYEAGVITDADIKNATLITVTYDATLSADATAGTYENTAWVTAPDWETSKDIVYVNTYAIDIFKYDQADNTGLVGAEFELKNSEGVVISTVTSGQDGHVVIDGLDAGTYTLTETKAPDGYVKSNTPLTIVIPDDADETFTVNVNFANSQIPHTGGTGTLMFTIGGIVIIATAGVLLLVSRKKKKTDA